MNRKWIMYGALVLAGVVLANRIRAIGPLSKIPQL